MFIMRIMKEEASKGMKRVKNWIKHYKNSIDSIIIIIISVSLKKEVWEKRDQELSALINSVALVSFFIHYHV